MSRLRVALCQLNMVVGDLAGNTGRIIDALASAEEAGADLAVFPELAVTGYPPGTALVLPGDTWHFHWAKSGEYVTQVTAIGPLGLEYANLADDPRHRAADKGQLH